MGHGAGCLVARAGVEGVFDVRALNIFNECNFVANFLFHLAADAQAHPRLFLKIKKVIRKISDFGLFPGCFISPQLSPLKFSV
jgi:hypothetical protein